MLLDQPTCIFVQVTLKNKIRSKDPDKLITFSIFYQVFKKWSWLLWTVS